MLYAIMLGMRIGLITLMQTLQSMNPSVKTGFHVVYKPLKNIESILIKFDHFNKNIETFNINEQK